MKLLRDPIFHASLCYITTQAWTLERLTDQRPVFKVLDTPEYQSGAMRPQALVELRSIFSRSQQLSLRQGKKFVCSDEPTLQNTQAT
jgi:hypothetical protein